MRYFLDISYKGTAYGGWQVQPNAPTIQAELNSALSILCKEHIHSVGAGRTDAGVHAEQLTVHFDWEQHLQESFLNKLNGILPRDIAARKIYTPSQLPFHARFDATSRAYRYQISLEKNPLMEDYAMWVRSSLNFQAMQKAAFKLTHYRDFASFCKAHGDQKTTLCIMHYAYWVQHKNMLYFHVQANRFLRGMVRAIVGTLLLVGTEKITITEFEQIIQAMDRSEAGPNAEAKGLFLKAVGYPPNSLIPCKI